MRDLVIGRQPLLNVVLLLVEGGARLREEGTENRRRSQRRNGVNGARTEKIALVAGPFLTRMGRDRAQRGRVDERDAGHKPVGHGWLAPGVTLAHWDAGLQPASRPRQPQAVRASPFCLR